MSEELQMYHETFVVICLLQAVAVFYKDNYKL